MHRCRIGSRPTGTLRRCCDASRTGDWAGPRRVCCGAQESQFHGPAGRALARGHFPNDRAASELIYLALMHLQRGWRGRPAYWRHPQRARHPVRRTLPGGLPISRPSPPAACRAADWTPWMSTLIRIQSTLCRAVPRQQPDARLAPPAFLPSIGPLLGPHKIPDTLAADAEGVLRATSRCLLPRSREGPSPRPTGECDALASVPPRCGPALSCDVIAAAVASLWTGLAFARSNSRLLPAVARSR